MRAYQGDLEAAEQLYRESFVILLEIHDREFVPSCLEGLATAKARQSELAWAARLWGSAEAQREAIGTPIAPIYLAGYQQAVANARIQLGEEAFARAWSQGRAMTPEQALTNPNSSTNS